MLINFVYLLKEPAFSFIDLCYCFLCFYFISTLIFMISFLLLTLGFVCSSFSSSFRCKVRLVFFNDTATTEIYTLSLHDALPIFCSCFLFLPGSVLEGCTFLRICPFLPGCPFYWHIVTCSSLLGCFVFLPCLL